MEELKDPILFSCLNPQAAIFWAKSSDKQGHPLLAHMLDVAAVAESILELEPVTTHQHLAKQFGLAAETAPRWLAALAGFCLSLSCCGPTPMAPTKDGEMPNSRMKYCRTDSARRWERRMLSARDPVMSVCPTNTTLLPEASLRLRTGPKPASMLRAAALSSDELVPKEMLAGSEKDRKSVV